MEIRAIGLSSTSFALIGGLAVVDRRSFVIEVGQPGVKQTSIGLAEALNAHKGPSESGRNMLQD
jgi:hypothetical protein